MAKPRVFVSSTYYDLKHVRASLDLFIESLGYDSVLSEKGDIAYAYDRKLDESCYVEVGMADIFVLIVGGRYGSASSDHGGVTNNFYERYESITRREYERAVELDIPIFIAVDSAVQTEYQTFKRNRDNETVQYVHVDRVGVFELLDYILGQSRNNPTFAFERYTQMEEWLRDQWAGLFRDLLKRTSQNAQLLALSEQVAEMKDVNQSLKSYLERVLNKVDDNSTEVIRSQDEKIARNRKTRIAEKTNGVNFLSRRADVTPEDIVEVLEGASTLSDFAERLAAFDKGEEANEAAAALVRALHQMYDVDLFLDDLNEARSILGKPDLKRSAKAKTRIAELRAELEKD